MERVNVVGTPNAVEDVFPHRKPGKKRGPFLRYFRFNLPRLTRALMLVVIGIIGGCAFYTTWATPAFPGSHLPLYMIGALAAIAVVLGVAGMKIWDFGAVVAFCALMDYMVTLFVGTAPFVWNGATVYHAAAWNVMMFASIAYTVLMWAKWYGMIVVWPDDQNFTD